MRFKIGNTQILIDWLMLFFPLIAIALGEGAAVGVLLTSLLIHESAHWLAAMAVHVPIYSIRLTPFGGLARMENPYSIDSFRICMIALAGPAANLLCAIAGSAMVNWNLIHAFRAAHWIRINLLLMAFNLSPALPLDGGRILYGLLSAFLPKTAALNAGIVLGNLLGLLLTMLALWGLWVHQTLNLSPLFAAIFLFVSMKDERNAFSEGLIQSMLSHSRPILRPTRAALIAIDAQTSVECALRAASPGRVTLYAVFEKGHFSKLVDDRTLIRHLSTLQKQP